MRIIVCVKQVLDPEMPPKDFRLDPAGSRPAPGVARMVIDSYAENGLEMAIQLRDRIPGSKVIALCLGDKASEEILRRALAFTADAAVRVWDPAWTDLDGLAIAHVLAKTVEALGGADLILTGRQAGDVEEGLVGPAMAEELGIPSATLVSRLEVADSRVRAIREAESGHAAVSLPLPALLTVTSSEINVPRMPKVKDNMLARGKPIKVLGGAEIAVHPDRIAPGVKLKQLWIPRLDVECELLPGTDGSEQAQFLVQRLHELKLV